MAFVGVIGGSGFYEFAELSNQESRSITTSYGEVYVTIGYLDCHKVAFIPRHGVGHAIPPHKVNYRANIAALSLLKVDAVFAFNAVGGISENFGPGVLTVPDQIIDYSYGREHTFFDGTSEALEHVDFTTPFDDNLRQFLLAELKQHKFDFTSFGVYGCTQGPRLETAAEIKKLKNDGCDIVGMTVMPEAVLAREKKLAYASLCLIVNWGAGLSEENISLNSIMALLNSSIPQIREVMLKTIRSM